MCGISGIIKYGEAINNGDRMVMKNIMESQDHRGPDGNGIYVSEKIMLGHNRLSIIDLSKRASQPMSYLKRYVITFNGEIYNYVEIKKELEIVGYKFKTTSDTEVILAAYDCWGINCQNKFNGMWAFCIVDNKTKKIFLSRDRLGVKPLYYREENNSLIFASEVKALRKLRKNVFNKKIYQYYKKYGNPEHNEETLIEEIKTLRPGHYIRTTVKSPKIVQIEWWNIRKHKQYIPKDEKGVINRFKELLVDSVRLRMRSDVPVGITVSGGLDSSVLLAIVNQIAPDKNKVHAFSSVQYGSVFDESKYLNILIEHTSFKNIKIIRSDESKVEKDLNRIMYFSDLPYNSPSQIPVYYTYNEISKAGIKVIINGQGADELLSGYDVGSGLVDYFFEFNIRQFLLTLKTKLIYFSGKTIKEKLIYLMQPFYRFSFKEKGFFDRVQKESYDKINDGSLNYILRVEDKLSMCNGIETRNPYLDYRLVTFMYHLGYKYKIKDGYTKWILRKVSESFVPMDISYRRDKIGFPPRPEWFLRKSFLRMIKNSLLNGVLDANDTDVGLLNILRLEKELNWNNVINAWRYYSLSKTDFN